MRLHSQFLIPALLLSLLLLCGSALANSVSAPRAVLDGVINQVFEIMKDPGINQVATRPALLEKVSTIVEKNFDFEAFSARTVGPNWNSFSDDQKTRFIAAFSELLRASYIEKIAGYNGEQVSYSSERMSKSGDKVEIMTQVNLKDKSIPVGYRMALKAGTWTVYDVIVEGVSLVQNYRGQFQEVLLKNDPEELIRRVQQKADEIEATNDKVKP